METLKIYNQLKLVPDSALREIQAGRLRGKSDINPQWRYQKLTEVFGPCGFGWKFTVDKQWIEPYSNGEIACFVNISLFVKHEGEWSEAIPGNGGSMFVANEKNGPYVSDEAFKMATTDALGTAAKMIGLASDVYMGLKNKNIPNQTKYPTQNNPVQDEKPWLNKADYDKAQEYIRSGGKLEVIKAKYRISKEMMENLNQVINQATK
jgi:hypothetical protein